MKSRAAKLVVMREQVAEAADKAHDLGEPLVILLLEMAERVIVTAILNSRNDEPPQKSKAAKLARH